MLYTLVVHLSYLAGDSQRNNFTQFLADLQYSISDEGERMVVAKINITGGFDNTSCVIMNVNVSLYVASYPKCAHYRIQ